MRSCRTSPTLLAMACLAVLLLVACARSQQESAPGAVPAEEVPGHLAVDPGPGAVVAAAAAAEDAAAHAALERAVRFQRGDTPRAAPRSLHGRFYVGLRDQDGAMIKASVERWYTVQPERMLTTRTEQVTGSTSTVGYDGKQAWFRDQKSGDMVVYTDDPGTFDEDLAQLGEQLRLTRLLLEACVLDSLLPRLVEPRVTGKRTLEDLEGTTHEIEVVTARVPDQVFGPAPGAPPPAPGEAPPMLELELGIDARTGAPWLLGIAIPHRPDLAPMLLRFDFFGRSRDGLRVPGNIRVFQAGAARERMTLGVAMQEGESGAEQLALDVDADLEPALFTIPR
jgi:hypothetical protein